MKDIFVIPGKIITAIGIDEIQNFSNFNKNISGISLIKNSKYSESDFYGAEVNSELIDIEFSKTKYQNRSISKSPERFTKFEKMIIITMDDIINKTGLDLKSKRTGLILSTTKGNINLLEHSDGSIPYSRIKLWDTANTISNFFEIQTKPVVVSNACISGVLAIITGARLLNQGKYDNVLICGADVLSKFVVSGFQSFKSLGKTPCKPFDKDRDGLTLGEGAGTLLLTSVEEHVKISKDIQNQTVLFKSGTTAGDANHISGPSRTGDGLFLAISKAIREASNPVIDYISAHGTATVYNDDMESFAISRAELNDVPTNSIKGYIGHTLGAAGIIETIVGINSMNENLIYATKGCEYVGVQNKINVITRNFSTKINNFLKIASGFGGCNAAAVFSKL